MGFPLSRFQQLASLCRDSDRLDHCFSHYNLVAIVVHSPGQRKFANVMKTNFERLHTSTGPSFAFITFLDPPKNWARIHREWMQERKDLVCGEGCEDDEFVESLQRRLNLPEKPCLVLTSDLMDNNYIILPTSPDSVVGQMEAIGREFTDIGPGPSKVSGDRAFLDFLRTIGKPYAMSTEDGGPLARNIADLLAVRSIGGAGIDFKAGRSDPFIRDMARDSQRREAIAWVKDTLAILQKKVNHAKESEDEEESGKALMRYSEYLAEYAAAKSKASRAGKCPSAAYRYTPINAGTFEEDDYRSRHRRRPELPDGLPSIWERQSMAGPQYRFRLEVDPGECRRTFEKDSYNAIRNYNRLVPSFFAEEGGGLFDDHDGDLEDDYVRDFSPLGCWLGNIVEEEMNASVVQLLRQGFRIQMPDYFRIYDPGKDMCEIQTRDKKIYLNKKAKRLSEDLFAVKTLPIGDASCVIKDCIRNGNTEGPISEFATGSYLDLMKDFGHLRNRCDHPGTVTREEFIRMFECYDTIRKEILPKMIELKKSLNRPKEPEPAVRMAD